MSISPTLKERYDLARDHLKHEDGLINQRVTWFLVFQGLLFTALVSGIALLDPGKALQPPISRFIAVVCVLIPVLAAVSALIAHALVRAAYWHVYAVHAWWDKQLALPPPEVGSKVDAYFPPLRGLGAKPEEGTSTRVTAAAFLLVLALVWIVLLALAVPILLPKIAA